MRRTAGLAVALVLSALVAHAQQKTSMADLKTKAEASDFTSTSNYEDVVSFMKTVAAASPKTVFYSTYGFTISANNPAQNFEGHAMRKIEGTWESAADATVPRGALEVSTNQPLGRLAFYLLEPASDDGLVAWNFLDDQLKDARTYPILRKK